MGLLLLFSGIVIGASGGVVFFSSRVLEALHHPERVPPRMVGRMEWQYGLDDQQSEEMLAIFTDLQEELVQLRDEDYPHVSRLLDDTKARALEILDEDQREKFSRQFENIRGALVVPPREESAP